MKVIIAGMRDFNNYATVAAGVIASGFHIDEVVSGGAAGVDCLGERYAHHSGLPVQRFPANWSLHGKAAGPIRNRAMAAYADALIAVWDGKSRGTKNMIEEATKAGLKVYVHRVVA